MSEQMIKIDEETIKKVAEHEVRLNTLETNQKDLTRKVEDIHTIATSVELIANNVDHMKSDVSDLKEGQIELKEDFRQSNQELKDRIKDVETAPDKKKASKLDAILDKLIWIVVGGIAVYLLTQILPNIKWT